MKTQKRISIYLSDEARAELSKYDNRSHVASRAIENYFYLIEEVKLAKRNDMARLQKLYDSGKLDRLREAVPQMGRAEWCKLIETLEKGK